MFGDTRDFGVAGEMFGPLTGQEPKPPTCMAHVMTVLAISEWTVLSFS